MLDYLIPLLSWIFVLGVPLLGTVVFVLAVWPGRTDKVQMGHYLAVCIHLIVAVSFIFEMEYLQSYTWVDDSVWRLGLTRMHAIWFIGGLSLLCWGALFLVFLEYRVAVHVLFSIYIVRIVFNTFLTGIAYGEVTVIALITIPLHRTAWAMYE